MVINNNDCSTYPEYFLSHDIAQVTLVVLLFQIPNVLLIYSDYLLFGFGRKFMLLLAVRFLMLIISLGLCLFIQKLSVYKLYSWSLFAWSLLAGAYILFLDSTRPPGYILYGGVNLMLIVGYYLLLPNRFWLRIIPPLLFSAGGIILLLNHIIPTPQIEINVIIVFYLVVNFLFFLVSQQMYGYRKRQYNMVLDQEELTQQLNILATTDSLTGIYNRRELFDRGKRELERYLRYGGVFSLMFIDIDHFKEVNDTYGHQAGDEILKGFTRLIRKNIRCEDIFGRIGGEEFVLILPETNMDGAACFINRAGIGSKALLCSVEDSLIEYTVSTGMTESKPDDTSFEGILHRADEGLYRAKARGRNLVEIIK